MEVNIKYPYKVTEGKEISTDTFQSETLCFTPENNPVLSILSPPILQLRKWWLKLFNLPTLPQSGIQTRIFTPGVLYKLLLSNTYLNSRRNLTATSNS